MIVYIYVFFVICSGLISLIMLSFNTFLQKNTRCIDFTPKSINETEYELRRILFKYPDVIIKTTQNPVSSILAKETSRVIIRPET